MKRQAKDTVFWPYLCEISKMADKALSTSCYLDEEAHLISNEFSFEEKDSFLQQPDQDQFVPEVHKSYMRRQLHEEKDTLV